MSNTIHLWVQGKPAGSGSKTAYKTPQGRMIVTPASKYQKPWQEAVKWGFLQSEYAKMKPLTEALDVRIDFCFVRPNNHFGTGRNKGKLKSSAPLYPAKRPDVDKLARSTIDALTNLVMKDDSQIVLLTVSKIYSDRSGADIRVSELKLEVK